MKSLLNAAKKTGYSCWFLKKSKKYLETNWSLVTEVDWSNKAVP